MSEYVRQLVSGGRKLELHSLAALAERFPESANLPFSLKLVLENLLRGCTEGRAAMADVERLAQRKTGQHGEHEIAFAPARVLMQDFTGVPAVADLAAMRDAMPKLGGRAQQINPLVPAELVIDHSVQVDHFGTAGAAQQNAEIEFERNHERYAFLRWGQQAFKNFRVVPPDTGIVHQVNLEYLARVVFSDDKAAWPDTVVGTDSHTTMVNGLGVLGWGVGGIEAEAAMLGQPISMLVPEVVGFKLRGKLAEGVTATDLVLTITEMLRQTGVVGKFVEYFGPALDHLPLADRATIANMAPEYGATCGIFPIDIETTRYLTLSGRDAAQVQLVEDYAKAQGLWREPGATASASYDQVVELDLATVVPSLAGPKRPQDRVVVGAVKQVVAACLKESGKQRAEAGNGLDHGSVVIAAITSCTNTSNPSVMIGAGLLARKARQRGLKVPAWVKTSLAPGSLAVRRYLDKSKLSEDLDALGFQTVGFGCTTCIGNSGPLPEAVANKVQQDDLMVGAVLSGNRNFEGRVHPQVRLNFLASPPLVVAYALVGRLDINLDKDALGKDSEGTDVMLTDIWPSQQEISDTMAASVDTATFRDSYKGLFDGDQHWRELKIPEGDHYVWQQDSTYVRNPPFFDGIEAQPSAITPIKGARVLALLGDSITTDHISPAGVIKSDSPAGLYLQQQGVANKDFNTYGSRRGNHEVMMRGTFANIRLRNKLANDREGGWTTYPPGGEEMSIYDAAMLYQQQEVPLMVIAGKEYGTGSSRDWAAKGTLLLGVRAVLAESFERIHRSNLVGMGVLPLVFKDGESSEKLGLDGSEHYDIEGLAPGARELSIHASGGKVGNLDFTATVRIDTPKEWEYYQHKGILPYVLRQLAKAG
ncbi:MAG: aconitate hydratase AcnA [Candidatus Porifericomitaceae bacterium WSBS_2022_MAG_OTU9]